MIKNFLPTVYARCLLLAKLCLLAILGIMTKLGLLANNSWLGWYKSFKAAEA